MNLTVMINSQIWREQSTENLMPSLKIKKKHNSLKPCRKVTTHYCNVILPMQDHAGLSLKCTKPQHTKLDLNYSVIPIPNIAIIKRFYVLKGSPLHSA